MGKISIKTEKKSIKIKPKAKAKPKPKPKQQTQSQKEQTQSQSIVLNVGRSAAPRRRASTQTLQKKAVNNLNQTPTPNIIVPQAIPQNSNNEILRYIRESEQHREAIKKQEKSNELEKDKVKVKEKTPIIKPEEDAQTQFLTVSSQTISSLTSGTATPNPLSSPVDSRSLHTALDSLLRTADMQGENPNSGSVSLSGYNSLSSNNSVGSSILSSTSSKPTINDVVSSSEYVLPANRIANTNPLNPQSFYDSITKTADIALGSTNTGQSGSSVLATIPQTQNIDDLLTNTQAPPMPIEPAEEKTEPEDEETPLIIEPTQPEAPLLYEEEEQTTKPKQKLQIFIPPYKNYAFTTTLSKYKQPELEDKYDEVINERLAIKKILNDQLSNIGLTMPSSGITYQFLDEHKDDLSDDLIDLISYSEDLQAEEKRIQNKLIQLEQNKPSLQAEEPEQLTEIKNVDGGRDVLEFEDKIKGFTAKKLGQLLIDYDIENEDGFPFFIYGDHVKTKLLSSRTGNPKDTQMNKKELRDYLIDAYENGADIII